MSFIFFFFLFKGSLIASSSPLKQEPHDDLVYEQTRQELLEKADQSWQKSALKITSSLTSTFAKKDESSSEHEFFLKKLHSLILPKIDFEETPLSEAIEFLRQQSIAHDPEKKGINILLLCQDEATSAPQAPSVSIGENSNTISKSFLPKEPTINLQLYEIPFDAALHYIAKQACLRLVIEEHAVLLKSFSEKRDDLVTRHYQIPPSFFPAKNSDRGTLLISATTNNNTFLPDSINAESYLLSQGIDFPPGSCASYSATFNRLSVRNTADNIELIDRLVTAASRIIPSQVSIETKFIEVNQNDLEQLGFTWLLGATEIGSSGIYMSGGSSAKNLNQAAYPFPANGMNPIGDVASSSGNIQENSIDTVLSHGVEGANGASSAAPGVFSIAGVYSNEQFQMVLHALQQRKGIDVMAAPHITTKSGVNAIVKIIDELTYPTHYTPPQIPESTTNSSGGPFYQAPPTITPSFPYDWTTKNVGVTLQAKPTIAPDGDTIDLELHPQIIDFDGFINYGTPINTVGYTASIPNMAAVPFSETVTTNTINQPVFSIREITTSVTVTNGQTIVLGGLIREEIEKFHDKIPVLGDIPLAGRLFQSQGKRKVKKNLIIFVTTRIIDANGKSHGHESTSK